MRKRFLIIGLACVGFLYGKPYNLSICSIIENDAPFLKEWIEYHRLIGVDHFYIYDIDSKDRYKEVLKSYIQKKIVTFSQWPNLYKGREDDLFIVMVGTKIPAYENAAKYRAVDKTTWLINLQINEFLVPSKDKSLAEVLKAHDSYGAILLDTHCFDASVEDPFSKKALIVEHNTLALPQNEPKEKMIQKTIFRPDQVQGFLWPPYRLILKEGQKEIVLNDNVIQVNQYKTRPNEAFSIKEVKRKLNVDLKTLKPDEKQVLMKEFQIEDSDQAISRFIPELRKKMGMPPTFFPSGE